MPKSSKISIVVESIFCRIEERVNSNGSKQFTDEEILTLHSVFGATLQRAFEILEKYPTLETYSNCNNGRVLVEIKGENDRCYRVFPRINFCPCLAFKHQVIEKKSQLMCKHVLAARIAMILDRIVDHKVTQDQYLMLLRSMFEEQNG
ncbi:unnamed protein product [Pieris brassicae]|uniref:SWIM-type domain-containing protein n=1 Tax=Pieris brassicae TaxID=7116 RepID=A0A9P0XAX5_PIEBR|nr:unnamed protein product [Pieris brassicae]